MASSADKSPLEFGSDEKTFFIAIMLIVSSITGLVSENPSDEGTKTWSEFTSSSANIIQLVVLLFGFALCVRLVYKRYEFNVQPKEKS